jgi:transposase-like protein
MGDFARRSFYVRYAVSYRDLEEILAGRGVKADHTTALLHNSVCLGFTS